LTTWVEEVRNPEMKVAFSATVAESLASKAGCSANLNVWDTSVVALKNYFITCIYTHVYIVISK